MSEMQLEEIQVIGSFLQTIQGQGIQVLLELASTQGLDPGVRLNAALALTGLYDQFAVEAYGPQDPEPDPWAGDTEWEPPEPGELDGEAVPTHYVDGEGGYITEEVPADAMRPATEEELARIQARLAQAERTEEESGSELGGASGIGPRNPRATRRRRRHGRR